MLPRQLLALPAFGRLFTSLPPPVLGYDDFRRNGLLLPADAANARRLALPLHRGPHRHYNAVVIERMGGIERDWARRRLRDGEAACEEALFRITLLQRALYRRLLTPAVGRPALNRRDPLLGPALFIELDALAEQLWGATGAARPAG